MPQSFRSLLRHKTLTGAALLTLALGIGANTAIFSVVYGVLIRPLPFPESDRLVQLTEVVPGGTPALPGAMWVSNLTLHAWEPQKRALAAIANFSSGTATVGVGTPQRVQRGLVGPQFFDVLGVTPVAGRFFTRDEAAPGAAPTVVLASEMWRESFASDPTAVGRTLIIDEQAHNIIGVAPPGMSLPTPGTRFWTPARVQPPIAEQGRDIRVEGTRALARLAPGASTAEAAREGTLLARGVARPLAAEMLFGKGSPVEIHVRTLRDQMTMRVRPALLVLVVGVGLLLLIACANVANLLLSRGVSRERELAVRAALGASRRRLLGEVLRESVLLACAGGAAGIALAWTLVRVLPVAAPSGFPRLESVQMDWRALAFAAAVSCAAGVMAGLLPALKSARPDLLPSLREARGASSGRRTALARRVLLVAQASVAVVMLISAILLGRSFVLLVRTDAGYDASKVLTARVYLPGASRGRAETDAFVAELLPRLRALPGVLAAGASNMAPLGQSTYVAAFTVPVPGRDPVTARALSYVVTPGYAEALRLRVVRGRLLDERDLASPSQSMLVNEQFVRTFLPGVEPVGLRMPASVVTNAVGTSEIVGVVANVLKDGLDQEPQPELYVTTAHGATIRREVNVVLRTRDDPLALADAVRRLSRELRAEAAVDGVQPLTTQIALAVAQPRFATSVLLAFAVVALVLAAVGLYGVLSYNVAERRREIGVRTALGATRAGIVWLVVREGMTVTVLGLAAGVAASAAVTRLMQNLLFGIEPLDAVSFLLGPAALVVVALLACIVPARSAAAVDAAVTLRSE
jgi:predicted permease